jgi:uncharacterized protein (UPF0262 family)
MIFFPTPSNTALTMAAINLRTEGSSSTILRVRARGRADLLLDLAGYLFTLAIRLHVRIVGHLADLPLSLFL